jgi:hypothetical protein
MCGCGCPTVYFGHSGKRRGVEVVAEAAVAGTQDSILLFISESGALDSMEYVWLGEVPQDEFPGSDLLLWPSAPRWRCPMSCLGRPTVGNIP